MVVVLTTAIGLFVLAVFIGSILVRLPGLYREFQEVRNRWDDDTFWDDDYLKEL